MSSSRGTANLDQTVGGTAKVYMWLVGSNVARFTSIYGYTGVRIYPVYE